MDTTYRIEKNTLYEYSGGKVHRAKLKNHRHHRRIDSWKVFEGEDSEPTHLSITNRRDFFWVYANAGAHRGICGNKLPDLPRPMGTATFKPVVCSAQGDWESEVDGKMMATEMKSGRAVGVLKDERELHRAKRWRVDFGGNQAFLTILDSGSYTLLREDGSKVEGKCVSFEERYPKRQLPGAK